MAQQIIRLVMLAAVVPGTVFSDQSGPVSNEQCEANLRESGIIPQYADNTTMGNLKVFFPVKAPMRCGRDMALTKVQLQPTVTIDMTRKCKMATILFFDPDVPGTSGYLHWWVSNIPTVVMREGFDGTSGRTIEDYQGPGTPTGNHRETICTYCQEDQIKRAKFGLLPVNRFNFDPREVASKYSLESPFACNFMKIKVEPGLQPETPPWG